MKIYLIRHGKTPGNQLGKYIGVTDEALLMEETEKLKEESYPEVDKVVISPMLRCQQTAKLLYPQGNYDTKDSLRECDFGKFENKNWKELTDDPDYQAWIDSNSTLPFPGGEDPKDFKDRTCEGFAESIQNCIEERITSVAFVVHGGTIMAILERFAEEKKAFYEWHVKNAEGYEGCVDAEKWLAGEKILTDIQPVKRKK